jgi:hypothetical protein
MTKLLLTVSIAITIIIPSIMDLNETHMTNPLWPPHARFHWAIQWFSITTLNVCALFLLWGSYQDKGTRLSILIAAMAPLLFWGSFFPSMLMPGTSTWPDGIEPFSQIAPNVVLAVIISMLCMIAVFIDHRSRVAERSLRMRDNDSGVTPR